MKKKMLIAGISGLLFSSALMISVPQAVQAETSAATVTFTGDDSTPTDPVDPDDPDVDPTDPIDPGDPDNPGTNTPGPLSLDYVSNFDFGTHKIAATTKTYQPLAEKPHIQVTDKRGTGAGWDVQAKISKISSSDNHELSGATLKLVNANVKTHSANNSTPPSAADITLKDDDQSIFQAGSDQGLGTWVDNFDRDKSVLTVYAGTARAKTYTADITWTLTSGPVS
ncbi:MAG TPA: WxL domain-containing protein [Tetragenococcus sp.]|nr:WxL domain-containing protein [Tetragenococcus sp.]